MLGKWLNFDYKLSVFCQCNVCVWRHLTAPCRGCKHSLEKDKLFNSVIWGSKVSIGTSNQNAIWGSKKTWQYIDAPWVLVVIYQFMFEAMGFLQLRPLAHTSACYLVFKAFKRILDSLKHLRTDRGTYAEAQAQIKELMTFAFTNNSPLRLHLRNWVRLHLKSNERITPSETGSHYCQQVYSPNFTTMPDFDQDF